jgi:hypothetical protein
MIKKKLRIMSDWSMDLIFHSDVSMIKGYIEESHDNSIKEKDKKNTNNDDNKSKEINFDETQIKI